MNTPKRKQKDSTANAEGQKEYSGPLFYPVGHAERCEIAAACVSDGKFRATPASLRKIIEEDPALRGIYYSAAAGEARSSFGLPIASESQRATTSPRQITDADTTAVQIFVSEVYGVTFGERMIHSVIQFVAGLRTRHEIREYLDRCVWDGTPRIDQALTTYASAEDSEHTRLASRVFFLSAAKRGLEPGCKVDTALILHGDQGAGKSSFVRDLFGADLSTDSPVSIGNKEAFATIAGFWCVELAELASLGNKEVEHIKAFLSSQRDTFRPAYGRNAVTRPRSCVFVGTTNEQHTLRDVTGSRRFFPVTVGKINNAAIVRDRDQLWAEACARLANCEQWWPKDHEVQIAALHAEGYTAFDEWTSQIGSWLSGLSPRTGLPALLGGSRRSQDGFTITDVLCDCLQIPQAAHDIRNQKRVATSLRVLGYDCRRRQDGSRVWSKR